MKPRKVSNQDNSWNESPHLLRVNRRSKAMLRLQEFADIHLAHFRKTA